MSILIMGLGYVGVTTGLLLAELGWNVVGYDPNRDRLSELSQGKLPFHEPQLADKLIQHGTSGRIRFTDDVAAAVAECDVIFICVGTPARADGSCDLQYIRQASGMIGQHMQGYKLIVIKSTVPVGTHEQVTAWIAEARQGDIPFEVVSNPEFLREGNAWHDAMHPDRIVIGGHHHGAMRKVRELYRGIHCPYVLCSPRTAEMIKYASNAFLATKISYINELARLCDRLGVHVNDVAAGMGFDERIGHRFLQAGVGYGGSCFPKDVQALLHQAEQQGIRLSILEQVHRVNRTQVKYAIDLWEPVLGTYADKAIAVLGLAFKRDTDDQRESPALSIIAELLHRGAYIRVHDPMACLSKSRRSARLAQLDSVEEALRGADAAIIATDWPEYAEANWARLREMMKEPIILDGKNMLIGVRMQTLGFVYRGIGTNVHGDDQRRPPSEGMLAPAEGPMDERMSRSV
jgi:nucleotide sugar dehydrogenase